MSDPVRILILEDNSFDAELVTRQLKSGGLQATPRIVSNEHDFRDALLDFNPQLIVSDFSLPSFDGLSALEIAGDQCPLTPFIFVSGTIGEERAIDALKRGAADYILKDNLKRLVPAIEGALRQAEVTRARDHAEEMLRARESRLRDIINTSHAWIWECDQEGRYTFSSPSVSRVLGFDHVEVLGQRCDDYCHPEDREHLASVFEELRSGHENIAQITLRCRDTDGGIRWIERDMVARRDEQEAFLGLRGADRDVTDRKTQELRIQRLHRALAFLSEANSAMLRIRGREELLEEACRFAVQIGGYSVATIYIRPAQGGEPIIRRAVSGPVEQAAASCPNERLDGDGMVARALRSTRAIAVSHHAEHDTAAPESIRLLELGLRSSVALPLIIDGTPIGVLQLHSAETEVFGEAELNLLRQVSGNIAFALQYLHNQDTARFLQFFDPTTALPKRALYVQRLESAIETARREAHSLAVLVFDIKDVRMVNDSLGRDAGDLALQLVAERLKDHFRTSSCLAHLGGGSYSVFHGEILSARDTANILTEDVYRLFDEPFALFDHDVGVAIRAGIALYPDDGDDADALLRCAETALGKAKDAGEEYLRHHADMNAEAAERLTTISRLRQTVAQRNFELHYQPKVSLHSGEVEGVEALLRWRDPDGGFVAPGLFVPMLESNGLIDEVGRWVIRQALQDGKDWTNSAGSPLPVAVNVSPLQLRRADFADTVLRLMHPARAGEARLELEITESMLMADIEKTIAMLVTLREFGVSVAIDDFGTGYSSLRILSQLPVDVLKIDRSFVSNLGTEFHGRTVVQTTISLADALGLKTIAEGVETEEQMRILKELGCGAIQGYLIHSPMAADKMSAWLDARPGDASSDLPEARQPASESGAPQPSIRRKSRT